MVKLGQRLKDCHAMSMLQSENEHTKNEVKSCEVKKWSLFFIVLADNLYHRTICYLPEQISQNTEKGLLAKYIQKYMHMYIFKEHHNFIYTQLFKNCQNPF